MNQKLSIIIFCLFVSFSFCQICPNPQKTFYLSYDAIGNREYLSNLFENISVALPYYNVSYNDKNGSTYSIMNLHPHFYYNSHLQIQQYNTQYSVNVTLGQLYLTYRFDFDIKHENKNITGWARGRTQADHYTFSKKIKLDNGAIHWEADNVPALQVNSQFYVEYSTPTFTVDELSIITQMLNDNVGGSKMKASIVQKSNQLFVTGLKDHLNHEELLKSGQINYKYDKINLNFTHIAKDFKMNNLLTKGLEVFLQFGLDTPSPLCNQLPAEFDQQSYGGVQEIISIGSIKEAVIQAINQGLFDTELDKKSESPYFQFYMGDLGNFVQFANTLPARDQFTVKCNFARARSNQFKMTRHSDNQLYLAVPQECQVLYQNSPIIKVSFDLSLTFKIIVQQNYLVVQFSKVFLFGDSYEALDSKFVVTDKYTAKYAIQAILEGFVGKRTFGTNWPTFYRKYPAVRVLDDYIILFDPAQK